MVDSERTREPTEQLVVIAKPEAVHIGLGLKIIRELEGLGLTVLDHQPYDFFGQPGKAELLYAELAGEPYFREPVLAIQRGPVHVFLVEGPDAVRVVRDWLGPTSIPKALEGDTFRGRMLRKHGVTEAEDGFLGRAVNYAHASSDPEAGKREAELLFPGHRHRHS